MLMELCSDNRVSVSFLAAPGPATRAQMVHELICSALYLKQQIPCPLREIEAQAQSGGKGPTLRKYRQYIDALNAVKQDLASLFQNDLLQVLEVRVLFGVSWTTPKDGVVLSFADCQPEITDETLDGLEDGKPEAFCRKLLRAAIPVVGGHTLALNKMHVLVKAVASPELAGSGWHHRLHSLVLAKSTPRPRKLARNCREPSKIDLVAPPVAENSLHVTHPVAQPSSTGFALEIYDDGLASSTRKRSRDEALSRHGTEEEDRIGDEEARGDQGQGVPATDSEMQLETQAATPAGPRVVWLHSRRGLRGLPR